MTLLLAAMLLLQEKAETDAACIACHEDQGLDTRGSVHQAAGVGCISCHGPDEISAGRHRMTPGFRPSRVKAVAGDCGTCHVGVLEAFGASPHFTAASGFDGTARLRSTCSSCHGHHDTRPGLE